MHSLPLLALLLLGSSTTVLAQDPIDLPNKANANVVIPLPATPKYDYSEVLHLSLLFYHSQRSGKLGPNRRLAWRGDSCFQCSGLKGEDLTGGYYEAANTMKWGLPLAFTVTQLAFNVYIFGDAMASVNEKKEAMEGVKWGTDYLVNCITDADNFVGQFGIDSRKGVDIDFGYFGPPEEYEMWAPLHLQHVDGIAYINSTNPSSEILAETAATFAATAVIFKDTDPAYSSKLIDHAKDLWNRAIAYPGTYMNSKHPNLQTVKEWYPSSLYYDELAWGAAWIFTATGEQHWHDVADQWIAKSTDHNNEYSWDEKLPGVYALMYYQTKNATYQKGVEAFFKDYLPGGAVKTTPKGLSFYEGWGSLSYAANVAFIMMTYAKTIGFTDPSVKPLATFAAQNLNYILGDCGRSWVVGFGKDWPHSPYHKSSYNSFIEYPMRGKDNGDIGGDFLESNTTNRFILYGALVGGPAWDDSFKDDRHSYEYTDKSPSRCYLKGLQLTPAPSPQVTQDYNAAFTGLNAAMIDYYGKQNFKAFTDCGLNLGWQHPNASNPPNWGDNDCYHTCNTNCNANNAVNTSGTSTGSGSNNGGKNAAEGRPIATLGLVAGAAVAGLFALIF